MLIVCDFDGTVTARDTNSALARRYAADRYAAIEGRLARREVTVRETLAHEFEGLDVPLDALVRDALEIPLRAGFRAFVDDARAAGATVVLLSSGFRPIIEAILEHNALSDVQPLVANELRDGADGLELEWRDLPECGLCGEHCKRHDVEQLRAGALHDGRAFEQVVFVGDGFSDRCGADIADRIFARDSLAGWLDGAGVAWEPWDDFDDIAVALGLRATAPQTDPETGRA